MSYLSAFCMVVVVVVPLLVTCDAAAVGDGGYNADVSECVNLYDEFKDTGLPAGLLDRLGTLCVDFRLDSCKHTLHANVTYGSDNWINANIEDGGKYEQCGAREFTCQTCYGLKNITVTPYQATVCPYVEERCSFVDPDLTLACYTLGSGCAGRTCRQCMSDSNCAWCDESKSCLERGRDGPYCASCDEAQWWTELQQCPPDDISESSSSSGLSTQAKVGLGISMPIIGGVLLAVLFAGWKAKRKRERGLEHMRLMQVEQEELESVSGLDRDTGDFAPGPGAATASNDTGAEAEAQSGSADDEVDAPRTTTSDSDTPQGAAHKASSSSSSSSNNNNNNNDNSGEQALADDADSERRVETQEVTVEVQAATTPVES